jgi:hypothetical protein
MKRLLFVVIGVIVTAGIIIFLWSGDDVPRNPESLVLYSLQPTWFGENVAKNEEEQFHGFKVLGKTEIKDAAVRRKIMTALSDAIARRPKVGAKCFEPRHGIRVASAGRTVEYVICFECSRYWQIESGRERQEELLNPDVAPTFNESLKAAGIPIAPGLRGE